jgi:hypothetical protein
MNNNIYEPQVLVFPKDTPLLKKLMAKDCIGVYVATQGTGITVETTANNLLNTIALNNVTSIEVTCIPANEVHSDEYLVKVISITK